jgi:hypothetical protein
MVTKLNEDPDWVWSLREVKRPCIDNRSNHDIRIFDPRAAQRCNVKVENYTTLDNHPDIILYSGTIDTVTSVVQLQRQAKAA